MIDSTHDATRKSWVAGADSHPDFPLQNLPLGIFSPPGGSPRGGVAIGDWIFDLGEAQSAGLLTGEAGKAAIACAGPTLNPLMAMGPAPRRALRQSLSALFETGNAQRQRAEALLYEARDCRLHLPAAIGDYTDFYAGIQHATNVGTLLRPDNPLMPNYKYIPVGYHGRASSVRLSGEPVRRPQGQRKRPEESEPSFGPSRSFDYELELGAWIGPGNALGQPIAIAEAGDQLVGLCLLNDWSARDIQGWEYQPLGPFLAKSVHTTISPWIVTAEALAPFRIPQPPREAGDPKPLAYLWDEGDQAAGAFDITLEVLIETEAMRKAGAAPHRLALSNARHLYWTLAQMIAHHASNGCNLRPGDLIGSGTISAPGRDGSGSLLELSRGGREPVALPGGETRRFLEDGDSVILRAACRRDGFAPIGFGECRAQLIPALAQ